MWSNMLKDYQHLKDFPLPLSFSWKSEWNAQSKIDVGTYTISFLFIFRKSLRRIIFKDVLKASLWDGDFLLHSDMHFLEVKYLCIRNQSLKSHLTSRSSLNAKKVWCFHTMILF